MNVLIACEESQRVCGAFRAKGHEAYSCDIQEPSGGHPEWHILGDVLPILRGGQFVTMDGTTHFIEKWDMIIAHPPCTDLTVTGARVTLSSSSSSASSSSKASSSRASSSSSSSSSSASSSSPSARGVYLKRTCLWLKGLPKLKPTNIVEPIASWVNCRQRKENGGVTFRDSRTRSKTFMGIANAMASQWG